MDEIIKKLDALQPYDRFVYFEGFASDHALTHRKVMRHAMKLSDAGKVMLFQYKMRSSITNNTGYYQWIAVGAPEAYTNYVVLKAAGRIG